MKKKVILEQIRLNIFRSHSPDVSRFRTTQMIFFLGAECKKCIGLFTTLLHDHSIHIIFFVIVYHIVVFQYYRKCDKGSYRRRLYLYRFYYPDGIAYNPKEKYILLTTFAII